MRKGNLLVYFALPHHIHDRVAQLVLLVESVVFRMLGIHLPEVGIVVVSNANVVEFPLTFFQNH